MKIEEYLKFKKNLTEKDKITIGEIEKKISVLSATPERLDIYIHPILELLQKGLDTDNINFLDKIFFDFFIIRSNTQPHKERIYNELINIGKFEANTLNAQTHLVNVYRNIVSDLFDPYMNLIVSTLQFIEGTFISMQQTNLGLGERNKYEFVQSRLNESNFLSGYNPIVRNAISHSGTEGIIYENNKIIFRSIKRGSPFKIEVEKWTNECLMDKTLQLMDFIHAIDGCIEIIGFDTSIIIQNNKSLSSKFLDEIATKEQRLKAQASLDVDIQKIINDKLIDYEGKLNLLNKLFFLECKKRELPIKSISFNLKDRVVFINAPLAQIDINISDEVISRSLKLIRYGTIAIFLYKFNYEKYIISDNTEGDQDIISVEISGKDLEDYVKEDIGLYDLLNDNNIFINGEKVEVIVDFDKLEEIEYLGTQRRFPKRKR